jgi:hypothetical protein
MVAPMEPAPPLSLPWQALAADPLTFRQQLERLSAFTWLEARLFERLGAWAGSVAGLEWRALFGSQARHHAQHAQWLASLVPDVADFDKDAAVTSPSPGASAAVEELGAIEPPEGEGWHAAAAWYRVVLPRLEVSYASHRQRLDPLADVAIARVLSWIERDIADDRRAGEAALQARVSSPRVASEASAVVARIDAKAACFGPLIGWG